MSNYLEILISKKVMEHKINSICRFYKIMKYQCCNFHSRDTRLQLENTPLTHMYSHFILNSSTVMSIAYNKSKQCSKISRTQSWNLLSAGSVDNRLATCAAEASNPTKSSGASSEKSPTSNPDVNHQSTLTMFFRDPNGKFKIESDIKFLG